MSLRIGVFDSGVGGLTVLKELVNAVPAEYVYIGDSLRAPYGNRSRDELLVYMKELVSFLREKECDVFVNACNSLSSLDTEKLLHDLHIDRERYIDMVSVTKKHTEDFPKDARILLYATEATIASGVYQDVFKERTITTYASALLAFAIETGHQIIIDEEVDALLDLVIEKHITHIFLGCTHYPLIGEYLEKRFAGLSVQFMNPAVYVPGGLVGDQQGLSSVNLYTTKMNEGWATYSTLFPDATLEEISLA